jgi:hypothetical protein
MDRLFRSTQENITGENHAQDSVRDQEGWVIAIEGAQYIKDHILRLKFSDGKEAEVDFGPFLNRSLNPLIRRYLDMNMFKRFTVEHGDLFWNDYDLCFPIADLYEGNI